MSSKKYSDDVVKEDIKSFFRDSGHWVYDYGTASDCGPDSPYYRRQLNVLFEDEYFHWITNRLVNELVDEGFLVEEVRAGKSGMKVRFVYRKGIRYQKRAMDKRVRLIETYSNPSVSRAIGNWGEHISEFMFTRLGFDIIGTDTNEYGGVKWPFSKHDLDFVVEKDGIPYGVEVKNILPYMELDEFEVKLDLCEYLGIVPMWILRNAPQPQFSEMKRRGGFILLLKSQIYPYGFEGLAGEIWNSMRLPVTVWDRIPEKHEKRFLKFHEWIR